MEGKNTSMVTVERLERLQASLRELTQLWAGAPDRVKWLLIGMEADVNALLAEQRAQAKTHAGREGQHER